MTATVTSQSSVRFELPGDDGVGRIVVDRPDDAVNAVNDALVEDLGAAIRAARACQGLVGLVVASGKSNQFMAGADLKTIMSTSDPHQIETACRRFQAVVDELAWLPCTTVAAINGPALGAGLELALACDYRVALDAPYVNLGQPEVNLGLLPAGGGTQRLPRLIGLERALDLILNGRRLNAARARRARLLDEVVHPTVLERAAVTWASRPKRPLDRPLKLGLNLHAAADLAEQTSIGRGVLYRQARQAVLARTHGHYPAPLRALDAIEQGFEHGLAAGLESEAVAFGELASTPTAKHMTWLFLATQKQRRLSAALAAAEPRGVDHLAVVGAGFMGAAIAEVGAAAGLPVRLRDVTPAAVGRGVAAIRKMVDEGVARRRFQPREGRDIMQRVSGTTDYSGFLRVDVVIEAVFEDLAVKRSVVRELEAAVPAEAVIASNTSALPLRDIARDALHPERVVGMHFFSPAQRMPLLEVIRPSAAADWAVATAASLGVRMGKTVIVVGDSPGFYTSRVIGVMLNEAELLLAEGARIEEVDRAMTAFGFPVGPFVLYDEVGLEVAEHAGTALTRAFADRFPKPGGVSRLVAAGQTGRRAGAGFYVWPAPDRLPSAVRRFVKRPGRQPNPAVYELLGSPPARDFGEQAIQDRLALLFVNEAIRCLDEGVLQSPTDGDLGAVLGLGFPPFRGGPFHFADSVGPVALTGKLKALATVHGGRYDPADSLLERARAGRMFFEE